MKKTMKKSKTDSRTTSAAFKPERVLLTEHGLSLVIHSGGKGPGPCLDV